MKSIISGFDLLDKLIQEAVPQATICKTLGIGKFQLNRELRHYKGKGYKEYVALVVGTYVSPTSFKRKIEKGELDALIVQLHSSKAICIHLGLEKGALNALSKHFGYSCFTAHRKAVLGLHDVDLYAGKILTLIKLGYDAKKACSICQVNYDNFRFWFQAAYNVPMKVFVKGLQGRKHYEMHERKEYRQDWMRGNVKQKLAKRISTSILKCLGKSKLQKTSHILKHELGYTIDDLKAHLESQFDTNMTWDNHGTYWHIDHRIPVTWFTFQSSACDGFRRCWALINLQPKEATANITKGNRYAD